MNLNVEFYMKRIGHILMERDGISREEARELVEMFVEDLREFLADPENSPYYDPEEIIGDHFGLEPDYLF